MKTLQQNIINWAKAKGIDNPQNQYLKMMEEVGETAGAILKNKRTDILMEIGDIAVTAIIYHHLCGVKAELPEKRDSYPVLLTRYHLVKGIMYNIESSRFSLLYIENLARYYGSSLEECLTLTWNKIKDRQGETVNGTFIKND